jgi:hypothetical protein
MLSTVGLTRPTSENAAGNAAPIPAAKKVRMVSKKIAAVAARG